jgi:hypothetical protein
MEDRPALVVPIVLLASTHVIASLVAWLVVPTTFAVDLIRMPALPSVHHLDLSACQRP